MRVLDFEKAIFELESKIKELSYLNSSDLNIAEETKKLNVKLKQLLKQIYEKLTPWQTLQVARHENRPQTKDYVNAIIQDFIPLAGDRTFADDQAILAGFGKIGSGTVAVLGHQRGCDTEERIKFNFGMPHPEGYKKAIRIMELAEKFSCPLITFVDTKGAFPGVGAEERGQAESIAKCIQKSLSFKMPIITIIIGEGGSGGAVALAIGNKIAMLEYSVYSVISPEGCASILWRDPVHAETAAESLKITAKDLFALKLIDHIIKEPLGGAHRSHAEAILGVKNFITSSLKEMSSVKNYSKHRSDKFLAYGRGLS